MLPSVFDAVPLAPNQFHATYVWPDSFTPLLAPWVNPSLSKELNLLESVNSPSVVFGCIYFVAPLTASPDWWLDVDDLSFNQTQSGWNPTPVIAWPTLPYLYKELY